MLRVLTCLSQEHDPQLVMIALIICTGTVFSSFKTYGHALDSRDTRRHLWLVLTGFSTACGIWATHFIAMVAFNAGQPIGYDIPVTGVSFAVAAMSAVTGYWIAANGHTWLEMPDADHASAPGQTASGAQTLFAAAGGAIVGLGIAAMHFLGMSAVIVAGTVDCDLGLAAASIVLGMMLTAASLVAFRRLPSSTGLLAATGLLVAAICAQHFTAMAAVTLIPDPTSAIIPSAVDKVVLAVGIVGATSFVIGAGIVSMVIENLKGDLEEYVQKLQAAHEEVSTLNVELSNSILKLKEAQEEIVKKGKLAQLGQLTATVAHEIRNPLGAVKTAAYVLERVLKDKELGIETHLARINSGISRCDAIISELLDFARTRKVTVKPVCITDWVRQTVAEEGKNLPSRVKVDVRAMLPLEATASIDRERMRRVLVNLLSNASEAMVGKGRDEPPAVTVAPCITVTIRQHKSNIEIEVKDNGPGISDENMRYILEPLFTTKSFGVGLGLPAVQKILEQHGGGLIAQSRLGEGAAFTAWFPAEPAAVLEAA